MLGFLGDSVGKNPPAMQKMRIRSLGWEDPLEKEMATYSSISPLENPKDRGADRLQSMGSQKSQTQLSN